MNLHEARIRDYLCLHLELVEPGLCLIEKEFKVQSGMGAGGSIDILARDAFGHLVVIEIKRSDQAARAALHELTKYVALLKSSQGLQLDRIRVLLLSTEWHELTVPFSEYLKSVEVPTEGFIVDADADGCVSGMRRFEPVTLDQPLRLERAQEIHFYRLAERRDGAVSALAAAASRASISDFVVLSVDYEGPNKEVIYPHGAYFVFSSPVVLDDAACLQKFISETGISWEDLEEPGENFLCWLGEFATFEHDDLEIGYPEKLASMTSDGWKARVSHRAGRYATNIEVLPDSALIAEAMRIEGGAAYYLYRTSSPKFKPSWTTLKKDIERVVHGCSAWEHILKGIVNRAESDRTQSTISIELYNPADLVVAMTKAFGAKDLRYFSSFQVVENSSEGVCLYLGAIHWSGVPVKMPGDEFVTKIFGSTEHYMFVRHFGNQHQFYDASCVALGLESVVFEVRSPGSSSEVVRVIRGPDALNTQPPSSSLADFLASNESFGAALVRTMRSFTAGLV
ncbi:MAG: hypothetical protein CFE41_10685 [Burkholderiales bacterium PBB2]|nr:MAG: hypothetical protein CFE41_10685 [Burkholderiales bacterium PBB2]